jgi:superfamily I DNA/RNA helicase
MEWLRSALSEGSLALRPRELLVDEVQDISPLQAESLYRMLPEDGRGFFGIGDPDQAIYGFRGSTPDIRRELQAHWPELKTMALSQSYRASQQILEAAGLAMHSHPASGLLKAARPLQAELRYFEAPSDAAEAVWIADRIQAMLGATSHTLLDQKKDASAPLIQDLAPSDIAVLVRLKLQMPVIARALRERGIPVQTPSAEAFWQDEATAAVLALVEQKITQGLDGEADLKSAGLPPEWTAALAGEGEPPAPRLLAEKLAQSSRRTAIYLASDPWKRLAKAWSRAGSWRALLDELRWLDEAELLASKAESVRLLTLHAAKGLEFRAVFMPGLEQGVLPLDAGILFGPGSGLGETDMAEERRLLYVGLTRASEVLCLSSARTRSVYGRTASLNPSGFLDDLLSAFKRTRLAAHTRQTVRQRGLFS